MWAGSRRSSHSELCVGWGGRDPRRSWRAKRGLSIASRSRDSLLRFADQKMKMFGHDYVADHHETIPLTHLFEDVQKKIATTSAAEQTPTLITTGGYEMQIAGAVVSL